MSFQGSQITFEKPGRDLESQRTFTASANPSTTTAINVDGTGTTVCYDYFLKPKGHSSAVQRYMGPTHGKCRRLRVQDVNPGVGGRGVTGGTRLVIRLSAELTQNPPKSASELLYWIGKWLLFILALFWPSCCGKRISRTYPAYYSRYWGQLWASRSPREHQVRKLNSREDKVDLSARYPRKLILFDDAQEIWFPCEKEALLMRASYMAVSYRQRDFPEGPIKDNFIQQVRIACLQEGLRAYWLDIECAAQDIELLNQDLYRISDVFRGATKTLIMLADFYTPQIGEPQRDEDQYFADEGAAWRRWGDRVWTLPEALLSNSFIAKFGSGPAQPKTLRQVALLAYSSLDEEMAIINSFISTKDPLYRIERLSLLKNAIFRRAGTAHLMAPGSMFGPYPAEKVYALAGFFDHRILPDRRESEMMALARLSMANDLDRFAERMIAMCPEKITPTACWYSDSDVYGSNLWDIEPEVQIAGVTPSTAVVLDGCRAAAIRWKNFPNVYYVWKASWKRSVASYFATLGPYMVVPGVILLLTPLSLFGIILLVIGLLFSIPGPWLLAYATSGRILDATPWFIGVKGVMTAKDVNARLYGGSFRRGNNYMVMHTPTGTPSSVPCKGQFRQGDTELSEQLALNKSHEMYTLVDTVSNTIYHFSAARPPTVCVYIGREGGMGRYVLCSENCGSNELHKEAVLRMPSYIQNNMLLCDWLAIGGMDSCSESCMPASPRAAKQGTPSRKNLRGFFHIVLVTTFLLMMSAVPVAA